MTPTELDDSGMIISVPPDSCCRCRHWRGSFRTWRTCDAYPDRIPDAIWSGANPHTEPYDGDNGIVFERLEQA